MENKSISNSEIFNELEARSHECEILQARIRDLQELCREVQQFMVPACSTLPGYNLLALKLAVAVIPNGNFRNFDTSDYEGELNTGGIIATVDATEPTHD